MRSRRKHHATTARRHGRGRGLGGIIHTYQGYDPTSFPPPTAPPTDVVSGAFEHLLMYGSMRELTEEELARAVRVDPSRIKGLGPSIDALIAMLEERKRKILSKYETDGVRERARRAYRDRARGMEPPPFLAKRFRREFEDEQIRGLEQVWYRAEGKDPRFSGQLVHLLERLGEKYQVDELASKYEFTGRQALTVPEAIEVKRELELIDRLLEQLRDARKNAQIAVVDLAALAEFAEPGDIDQLRALQQQVEDYVREMARQQGVEFTAGGYRLTPKAMRIFQSRLLEEIFNDLQAARSGRHMGPVAGEGAVELPGTKEYEFGDSIAHMDIPRSMINAMIRARREGRGPDRRGRVRLEPGDIEIHRTRNNPKCATAVIMDMSGSMRYGGLYVACKRMGIALDGLIRREYPGDYLRFIEMYTFGKVRSISELPQLMPKPVTLYDPVVRLQADMSDENLTELDIPPHFTNIQHALRLARRMVSVQDTPNRQILLITDGLPTAHFEGDQLFLLYPPDRRTEAATMREAHLCAREGITINIFLLPSWSQSHEDVQFAQRMVEATRGRVFFTAGPDLDRFILWDYVKRRRTIIG